MKSEIYKYAEKFFEDAVRVRRRIHEYPETGFDVEKTAAYVVSELSSFGYKITENVGRTGVVFDLETEGASKTIALRADMDALNIQEMGDKPYKSKIDGKAHMCGHDCHTSILVTAGKILSELKDKLDVNLRLLFQPCEETLPGGANEMIKDGAIEGVDEIYGLHVWPEYKTGTIGLKKGPFMAQPDSFDIKLKGKGGHAAMPHLTPDVLNAGAALIQSFNTIISRDIDPISNAVLSVTRFESGTSDNIIPQSAYLQGTVRTFDSATKKKVVGRMSEVLEGISKAFAIEYEMQYTDGYPVNFNNDELTEKVVNIAGNILGCDNIHYPVPPSMGAEDFGYYSQIIPACFFMLGCGNKEKNIVRSVHDPLFDVDEECLKHGVALMCGIILSK